MANTAGEISLYRRMLLHLSNHLLDEDVQMLKEVMKDRIGQDFDRKLDEPLLLFDLLEKKRLLNETNVGFLKNALNILGRVDLVEGLEKYEQEEDFMVQKMYSTPLEMEGPFFGRERLLDSVLSVLNEKQSYIHVVCISGMPGAGKTRLAYEACYRLMQYHHLISVNLREITTIEAAFFAILHRLGVESKVFEPEVLLGLVKRFRPSKAEGAIVLLDSADHLLDPGTRDKPNSNYEPFIDLISHVISVMNPFLKVIITSRAGLKESGLNRKKVTCFSLEGDNELNMEGGVKMMQYYAKEMEIDRDTCEGLVQFCGKVPLAIKVVGSRFQDGNIKPKELLKYLQNTKSKGRGIIHTLTPLNVTQSDQLSVCLESSIRALPEVHKNYLIRLSVIPGTFSFKAARDILDFKSGKKVQLQLDLQNIMNRSLLESDRNEAAGTNNAEKDDTRYSMNLLLRSFIQQMVLQNDEEANIYREAEKKFISHFGGKLRKVCRMMETDYATALSEKDVDYANYQKVLMLLQSSTKHGSPEIAKWVSIAVNHLMVPKKRRTFFHERAQIMKEQKNMHSYADYKCHEVFQLLLAGEPAEPLLKILDEAEGHLKSLSKKDSEEVQLSLALCYQVRGDVLISQGGLSETHRGKCIKDANHYLEKALHIHKKYCGEHFLTARSLLSLGLAWQTIGVTDVGSHFTYVHNDMVKALNYYQEALDMVQSIAGSLNHMEAPNILVSMGTCMHEMGRHEKAIELFREALTLEEALGGSGTETTCLLLELMAMSCNAMKSGSLPNQPPDSLDEITLGHIVSKDLKAPLSVESTVTNDGGLLKIASTDVKLFVPAGAFKEDRSECLIRLSIIPPGRHDEASSSFCSNSSTIVELLPNNLTFKLPVQVTLPHCLQLKRGTQNKVKIFMSHHEKDSQPKWEEVIDHRYILDDKTCTIWMERFCWMKYEIDDEIVEAKRITIFTAASPIHVPDDIAQIQVGYHLDLPGAGEILRLNPNLIVGQQMPYLFLREGKHPLRLFLSTIIPKTWTYSTPEDNPQEISFRCVASSVEHCCPFILQHDTNTTKVPTCIFKVSQNKDDFKLQIRPKVVTSQKQPSGIHSTADVHQENVTTQAEENAACSEQLKESPQAASFQLPLTIPRETPDAAVRGKLPLQENQHERDCYTGHNLKALCQSHENGQSVSQTHGQMSPYHNYQMSPHSELPLPVPTNPFIQQNYYHQNFNISPYGGPFVGGQSLCESSDKVNQGGVTLGYSLIKDLGRKLDPVDALGNDWKELADKLRFTEEDIHVFERAPSPTFAVIDCAKKSGKLKSIGQLKTILENIGRIDASSLLTLPTPKDES